MDATREMRTEGQLRETLNKLCGFVWNGKRGLGEHLWTIPVDPDRDFDCILTDAIDELLMLRIENADLRQRLAALGKGEPG